MLGVGVWPPLPPAAAARRPVARLPFPLAEPGCTLLAKGRHALYAGARALGLSGEVLVPAYCHGSEVEALVRAGLEPRWYAGGPALEPDEDELEGLLGPHTRALHVTHYLGFPQDGGRWRRWCDERGLVLIEDGAQSWLAETPDGPVGSFAHLAIVCLYKSVGVPDGAALLVEAEPEAGAPAGSGAAVAARKAAAWVAGRSALAGTLVSRRDRRPGEDDLSLGEWRSGPSAATRVLLPRLARPEVAPARRAAYEALLEELGERVPRPFDSLPAGASPFAFPLETEEKDALLDRLAARGVNALDLWSQTPPHPGADGFPEVDRRRRTTVCLPSHQELGPEGVEHVLRAVRGPRRARPEPDAREEPFAELEEEWAALALRTGNVFATPDWFDLWWQHFGDGRRLLLRSLRDADGRLRAVLPLYLWRDRPPARIARFVGHDAGDQLGPVAEAADRAAAARALRRVLEAEACDALVGEQTAAWEAWRPRLGAQLLAEEGSPVLRLAGLDWEGYLASRSKNFRDQVRGRERKLARAHELTYRLCDDPARLDDDLTTLFRLHRARWQEPTTFASREAFHRGFAARALERGWLRLWLLELDGEPAAAWYGFRYGAAESYYQAGRRPELERLSLGFVLMTHTIREAIASGADEYRLLRGGEEYKYRFAATDRGLETIGLALTARGAAALGAARAARRGRKALGSLAAQAQERLGGKNTT
jgi:CelD/BcsL family acetyltransferase involved in cellulose biosynthesis